MLNNYYTKELIGLEDVLLRNVETFSEKMYIYIEMPRKLHVCPKCGYETDKIHDYRKQKIKDIPIRHLNTYLILRKRRYECPLCGKSFTEDIPFLPKYYHVTRRLIESIIHCIKESN